MLAGLPARMPTLTHYLLYLLYSYLLYLQFDAVSISEKCLRAYGAQNFETYIKRFRAEEETVPTKFRGNRIDKL